MCHQNVDGFWNGGEPFLWSRLEGLVCTPPAGMRAPPNPQLAVTRGWNNGKAVLEVSAAVEQGPDFFLA
jgi:hypothetical protein